MKIRTALPGLILLASASTGYGYYDDIHYGLTYLMARFVGFTADQAYRIASADASIDWSPETEPVQAYAVLTGNSPVPITKDQVPRWKFHAFRDEIQFGAVLGESPKAVDADRAILRQRIELYNMAFDQKNPGPYLHFYQDEVPHHSYTSNGGHWFRQTAISSPITTALDFAGTGLPLGGTTDWLSYRYEQSMRDPEVAKGAKPDANVELARNTARTLGDIMTRLTNGKQKPRPFPEPGSPEFRALTALLKALRDRNPYPQALSQACGWCVIWAKANSGASTCPKGCPSDPRSAEFQNHLNGPNVTWALDAVDAALPSLGISERIPRPHRAYAFDENGRITGSRDQYVIAARLGVSVDGTLLSVANPSYAEVVLIGEGGNNSVFDRVAVSNHTRRVSFEDVPVGAVAVELRAGGVVLDRVEVRVSGANDNLSLRSDRRALATTRLRTQ